MTSKDIRERFLTYFENKGHARVAGSPVIPWGDPTLLFTNAGMNQFKDVFLGSDKLDSTRATTCQKCIRAGGKHNDLDEVGRTTRHGTFLEMLGNFSFGDYFKEEAISFAWEFMTKEMGLKPESLYVSVYTTDDEAWNYWHDIIGVPEKRILRFGDIDKGDEENFWSMGPVGPCGPCSEIYFDRGPAYGPDDPYESLAIDAPRFLELWNLVFMQFNRDETGFMTPLPKPSIDTGLGLERMAMVHQAKDNIFETDILGTLIGRVEELSGMTYSEKTGMPFRVAADHIRTLTFAIADGAIPSNEGRGYVLRRILRRASRYLRELDVHTIMLYRLVEDVVRLMGDAYPEIGERSDYIAMVIKSEEDRFLKTLDQGVDLFERLAADVVAGGGTVIDGENAFKLYDTFGFPVDLTRIMAEEKSLTVDMGGFEHAMEEQRERARQASSFELARDDKLPWTETGGSDAGSEFVGYEHDTCEAACLRYRLRDDRVELVFESTPFYEGSGALAVVDVYDHPLEGRVHVCELTKGSFDPAALTAAPARLTIDTVRRRATERNHSSTHLLQAALQKEVGQHIRQSGSAVDSERMRFDFNHFTALTPAETARVEELVNSMIMANHPVSVQITSLENARKHGAMSLFEEKYGEVVRLVRMGDVSLELCGGTHVHDTGTIGSFRIVSESSVAAGIRRIEAITGIRAYEAARAEHDLVMDIGKMLNIGSADLPARIEGMASRIRELEKEVTRLRTQGLAAGTDILGNSVDVKGVRVAFGRMEAGDTNELKAAADAIREKIGSGVGVLGAAVDDKVSILVMVTDDLIDTRGLKAGAIVKELAAIVGGSGGGRPHMAMAGGKDVDRLDEALESSPAVVEKFLA